METLSSIPQRRSADSSSINPLESKQARERFLASQASEVPLQKSEQQLAVQKTNGIKEAIPPSPNCSQSNVKWFKGPTYKHIRVGKSEQPTKMVLHILKSNPPDSEQLWSSFPSALPLREDLFEIISYLQFLDNRKQPKKITPLFQLTHDERVQAAIPKPKMFRSELYEIGMAPHENSASPALTDLPIPLFQKILDRLPYTEWVTLCATNNIAISIHLA